MYVAKLSGMGFAVYTPELDLNTRERLAIATNLERAIHKDELVLDYQPKIDCATGATAGVEALVRWQATFNSCSESGSGGWLLASGTY